MFLYKVLTLNSNRDTLIHFFWWPFSLFRSFIFQRFTSPTSTSAKTHESHTPLKEKVRTISSLILYLIPPPLSSSSPAHLDTISLVLFSSLFSLCRKKRKHGFRLASFRKITSDISVPRCPLNTFHLRFPSVSENQRRPLCKMSCFYSIIKTSGGIQSI